MRKSLSLATAIYNQRQIWNVDAELYGPLMKRGQIILQEIRILLCHSYPPLFVQCGFPGMSSGTCLERFTAN